MAGTEYEFPAAALDAGRYVAVLQAELRAIAARLVMPEFMFTSDARTPTTPRRWWPRGRR